MKLHSTVIAAAFVCVSATGPQTPADAVKRIIDSPEFAAASAFFEKDHDRFVRELITLTEIPSPPFKEKRRAEAVLEMLRQLKLADVEMDAEGNVMGVWKGTRNSRLGAGGSGLGGEGSGLGAGGSGLDSGIVAVVAHMDTVFPEGTDVKVKRVGDRLSAPGVGDNTRGVALMLSLIRAIGTAGFRTSTDILFVGNVGEEGEGDLRGVKFLLQKGKYKDRIKQVIAIDGGDQSTITTGGVGSRRYRTVFKGPGGHSYGAFGLVNPAFAMAGAISKLAGVNVPQKPKTTFNVGRVRGGTSVNSIPFDVEMDVDMRSESCAELKKLDDQFLAFVREAVDEENKTRSTREGSVSADPKLIGDRPCGETPTSSAIVQNTAAVVSAFGMKPSFNMSSTDANLAMHLGIQAVTIGRGPGGRAHSLDEYTIVEPKADVQAAKVALAIILTAAWVGAGDQEVRRSGGLSRHR